MRPASCHSEEISPFIKLRIQAAGIAQRLREDAPLLTVEGDDRDAMEAVEQRHERQDVKLPGRR